MKTTREKSYIDRVKKSYKSLLKEIFDKHMKHVEIEPYTFSAEPIDLMRPQLESSYYSILSRKINELIDKVNSLSKE